MTSNVGVDMGGASSWAVAPAEAGNESGSGKETRVFQDEIEQHGRQTAFKRKNKPYCSDREKGTERASLGFIVLNAGMQAPLTFERMRNHAILVLGAMLRTVLKRTEQCTLPAGCTGLSLAIYRWNEIKM